MPRWAFERRTKIYKKYIDRRSLQVEKKKITVGIFIEIRKTKNNDQYFRFERVRCVVMIIIAHTYTVQSSDKRRTSLLATPSLETRVNTSYIIL